MLNLVDFTGKKIIVAGASSGIGRCTALTLSGLGAEVILIARREDKLEEVLKEIRNNTVLGGGQKYLADLSRTDTIEDLIKELRRKTEQLTGLYILQV